MTIDEQLFEAVRNGDVAVVSALLDAHPEKLHDRAKPYEWSLLHFAAQHGHLDAVDLLLKRGLDVNSREHGDNTYAMHWAAAGGHLDVVRRLADGGGDVVGHGDDHELGVIGWATSWYGCDDDAHRAIAEFLVSRGARHHIFSAIAMNLADEVRRIVADDPSALNRRMSRNEEYQLPLHFAVRMNRPAMVALLISLGADPLGVDRSGQAAPMYAMRPDVDRAVMEKIREMTSRELVSAERQVRQPRVWMLDLLAALALHDWETAARVAAANPALVSSGALHVMAKRNHVDAARWLLDRGANPNALWAHWDADVTPLHLAALGAHAEVTRVLLDAGADPRIRDSKHASDVIGWAEFLRHAQIAQILKERLRVPPSSDIQ